MTRITTRTRPVTAQLRRRRSRRSRRLALAARHRLSPAIWLTSLFLLLFYITA